MREGEESQNPHEIRNLIHVMARNSYRLKKSISIKKRAERGKRQRASGFDLGWVFQGPIKKFDLRPINSVVERRGRIPLAGGDQASSKAASERFILIWKSKREEFALSKNALRKATKIGEEGARGVMAQTLVGRDGPRRGHER